MKSKLSSYLGIAAAALLVGASIGEQRVLAAPQTDSSRKHYTAPMEQVTLVGCLVKESNWRKANSFPSRSLGAGNEFVLVDVPERRMGETAPAATGTAGSGSTASVSNATAPNRNTYELIGTNEKQAKPFLGMLVEVSGTLKKQEVDAVGQPTGGPTARITQDLRLRELHVTSVRASSTALGVCPNLWTK